MKTKMISRLGYSEIYTKSESIDELIKNIHLDTALEFLVLLNKTLETTGKATIQDIWPNAEVYFHGGVCFDPYKEQYKKIFPSSNFMGVF